jgi:hypothetical protein
VFGLVPHDAQLLGPAQQGQYAESEDVRRGLVAGEEHQMTDPGQLVGGEVVAVLVGEGGEQALARSGREIGHVGANPAERRRAFVRGQGRVERAAGEALEGFPVLVGDPEQLADHQ